MTPSSSDIRLRFAGCLVLGVVLGWLGSSLVQRPQAGRPPGVAPATNSFTAVSRGEALARSVCATCHLYPEPDLLTRTEWAHHILPQMALWLGVEPPNYESIADGRLLEQAQLYPAVPLVSHDDWFAIWNYYVTHAPARALPPPAKPAMAGVPRNFRVRKLNFNRGKPVISMVKFDEPTHQLFVGDAFAGLVAAISPDGDVLRTDLVQQPPVAMTPAPGGWNVTVIGRLFPSDVPEGKIVFHSTNGAAPAQTVLTELRRPAHCHVADLNQDGRDDLVVCEFGNRLGQLAWFEQLADQTFKAHALWERAGATQVDVKDFNGDGRLDLVVLFSQGQEGIFVFTNQGGGRFERQTLLEVHPSFGLVSFQFVDFDGDGKLDLLTANGDNGDSPTPHKRYHGVRIYRQEGAGAFREAWFYPMEGAYQARSADFDGDGDQDVAAISFYPDFNATAPEGFVYLEQLKPWTFVPYTMPESNLGRWMTMDVGDWDGDGDVDIAMGAFALGPTTLPIPAAVRERWRREGAAVLVLENLTSLRPPAD